MAIKKIILLIFLFYTQFLFSKEEICILQSLYNEKEFQWIYKINCPKKILNQKFSSGSLFKIFIAEAGFYYGILKEEDLSILNINFKTSDNPYFIDLIKKIEVIQFIHFLNSQLQDYFNKKIDLNDFTDEFSYLYGGKLLFTPVEIHYWFIKLLEDKRQFAILTKKGLYNQEKEISYYGKSGTWNGSAWYSGFLENHKKKLVITVLVPYKIPNWKPAKEKSYKIFINLLKENSRKGT